jgi:hypothetical protein
VARKQDLFDISDHEAVRIYIFRRLLVHKAKQLAQRNQLVPMNELPSANCSLKVPETDLQPVIG